MVYQANSMKLKMLSAILTAGANDVLLCKKIPDGEQGGKGNCKKFPPEQYLLWIIKDRKVIRYLLRAENELAWLECFPYGESLCIVMPYRERRSLIKFWRSQVKGREEKEELCRRLIGLCMITRLPAPILYLLLKQRQLSICEDGSLYFNYELDFNELDGHKTEKDCLEICVRVLQELSEPEDKDDQRIFELMDKKLSRDYYHSFLDLYLDWKRVPKHQWRWSPSDKMKIRAFYFLAVLAVILILVLSILIISQLAFGDVPLFRMFMETFRKIGTEVLGR